MINISFGQLVDWNRAVFWKVRTYRLGLYSTRVSRLIWTLGRMAVRGTRQEFLLSQTFPQYFWICDHLYVFHLSLGIVGWNFILYNPQWFYFTCPSWTQIIIGSSYSPKTLGRTTSSPYLWYPSHRCTTAIKAMWNRWDRREVNIGLS